MCKSCAWLWGRCSILDDEDDVSNGLQLEVFDGDPQKSRKLLDCLLMLLLAAVCALLLSKALPIGTLLQNGLLVLGRSNLNDRIGYKKSNGDA